MQVLKELRRLHASCNPKCTTTRCSRGKCALALPSKATLCIDCDRCSAFPEGRVKPDFIALHVGEKPSTVWWLVVEMKSGLDHPRGVIRQLEAGAEVLQSDNRFNLPRLEKYLVPLVLHTGIHTTDFATLDSHRIALWGRYWRILVKACGTHLEDIVG